MVTEQGCAADCQCQFERQCIDNACSHGTSKVTLGGSADIETWGVGGALGHGHIRYIDKVEKNANKGNVSTFSVTA